MKRVSAFAVFKTKKDHEIGQQQNGDIADTVSIKRATSTQSVDKKQDGKSRKLLRALKASSLRQSLRGTPRMTPRLKIREKPVAGDEVVQLTSMRFSDTDLQNNTPAVGNRQSSTGNLTGKSPAGQHEIDINQAGVKNVMQKETPKGLQAQTVKPRKNISGHLPPNGKSNSSPKLKKTDSLTSLKAAGKVKRHESPKKSQSSVLQEVDNVSSSASSDRQRKGSVKRPPEEITDLPLKKKKKLDNNNCVQKRDCSVEEMEHVMSFGEESLLDDQNLPYMYDSTQEASRLFESLIHPVKPEKFFKELWERKPLLVRRHMSRYNDGWFSTAQLDKILREEHVEFGVNLDVTSFTNGVRETHNVPGRAHAPVVWDYYQNGCSVRMLNPQTYSRNVWKLLSILQEYFGCCVGANTYLTPPGTQGFAPHYDDIEAFILQLEGKKHWRLYSPRSEAETLPRFSSNNFTDTDLGEEILEVVLEAGDLLYFPRGTIHQGKTLDDTHSLHITVSCYQKNTWGDLMEKLVPQALQQAIEEDIEFRKGLPRDYLHYMGIANSDVENPMRKLFLKKIEQLTLRMMKNSPLDAACDQLGKRFIHDSLPPVLSEGEKACSIHGNGERWDEEKQCVRGATELELDTAIKIIRKGVVRLLAEEEVVRIYHTLENARVYHGRDPQHIEIPSELAPAVEYLIHSYPEFVSVHSLPLSSEQQKVEMATILYEKGLLITGDPLEPWQDEDSDQH